MIELVLTGMMLVCLEDDRRCPKLDNQNTAWVVKAREGEELCGWSVEKSTELVVAFSTDSVEFKNHGLRNPNLGDGVCEPSGTNPPNSDWECSLSGYEKVCVAVAGANQALSVDSASLNRVPRIDRIDSSFDGLNRETLRSPRIGTRVVFPPGQVRGGRYWTCDDGSCQVPGEAPRWARSNGKSGEQLPGQLSAEVVVTYSPNPPPPVATLALSDCSNGDLDPVLLATFTSIARDARITLRNRANTSNGLIDRTSTTVDRLPYFGGYYVLGDWKTGDGHCPRHPVTLQCSHDEGFVCAGVDEKTIYWSATRGY